MNNSNLQIVPVADMPKYSKHVKDSPKKLYKKFIQLENLCRSLKGSGLSATQVGWPLNMYVICKNNNTCDYFFNCEYYPIGDITIAIKEKILYTESCLSLPNKYYHVYRFNKIKLTGKRLVNMNGTFSIISVNYIVSDNWSQIHQHEIDHAHGILISDIGKVVFI
jgi:peptide deformylase